MNGKSFLTWRTGHWKSPQSYVSKSVSWSFNYDQKASFYAIDEMASNTTETKQLVYKWTIFVGCISLLHLFTVWHIRMFFIFKSEHIWRILVNCNKYLTYVLVKQLPVQIQPYTVQKLTCLQIWPFNHTQNKANIPINRTDFKLSDVTLRRSPFAWFMWIRLFYKHAKFQHITMEAGYGHFVCSFWRLMEGNKTNKRQNEISFLRFGDLYNVTKRTNDETKWPQNLIFFSPCRSVVFGALWKSTNRTNDKTTK